MASRDDNRTMRPHVIVEEGAIIGYNVQIGAGSVVHAKVVIGDNCVIQEHCVLGVGGESSSIPLVVGASSVIRSHSVLYLGSTFGDRLETGHHVVIREGTRAGENLRVGNFCDVEGNCDIGDYCRFHGYVHVGKGTRIGNFVWLFSLTTTTNDPLPPSNVQAPITIEDGAVVCVNTTLFPGTRLGKGSFVSAGARCYGDIAPGAVITGENEISCHVSYLMDLKTGLRHPWMRHYRSVYPESVHPRLEELFKDVMESRFGDAFLGE